MIAKIRILFWLGIIALFIPFIGVTSGVKRIVTVIVGVLLVWLSFRLRREYKELRFRMRKLEEPSVETDIDIHTK